MFVDSWAAFYYFGEEREQGFGEKKGRRCMSTALV
jgi:hypothetical protein